MSVTLRLADDDAKVIADVLEEASGIVEGRALLASAEAPADIVPLVDKACKVPSPYGAEYMPYDQAAARLRRISAAFDTALKANVK